MKNINISNFNFILYFVFVSFLGAFFLFLYNKNILIKEDGYVEWLSAISYILTSIFSLIIFQTSKYKLLTLFWLFFAFICFGEECSWMQRQLKYSVDTIEKINSQGEFNIHNLKVFGQERVISKDGKFQFNYKIFLSTQLIFQLGLLVYFLIIPMLRSRYLILEKVFPKISNKCLILFWVLVVLSFALIINQSFTLRNTFAETRECIYAIFILLHLKFFVNDSITI